MLTTMTAGTNTQRLRLRLLCGLALTMALLCCSLVEAVAPVGDVPLGCILPLTGENAADGLRAKAALELLVQDVNTGVAVGGFASNFLGLAPGQSLVLDCRDSQSEILPALAALQSLRIQWGSSLVAVIGELSDRVTVPLDLVAQSMGIMLVSPAATSPSLGQTNEHPYFIRTIGGAESMTKYWKMINDAGGWRRLALINTDDDSSRGFADAWLREIAAMRELQLAGNYTGTASPYPYEVTSIVVPTDQSTTSLAAIGQALDQLMASGVRIIQMHAGEQAETILRMAHARGMVGEGPDGIVRQWLGDFCNEELAEAMQDTPGALFGAICNMPPLPRTRSDFPPTSPTAVAFESRLQAAYPSLFPNGKHIEHVENAAGSAVIALVGVMGQTFADASMANTAANFFSWLSPSGLSFTQPDGTTLTILPSGSADARTINFMGWDMADRSFKVTGAYTMGGSPAYEPSSNVMQKASGTTAYPKDRPRIYITSDELPVTFDGKMVVLAFVVVVLGAWTALILMEQALSFWSRAIWKQALGWVLLASVAFGACSVWPNTLMVYSSLTLDVDAKIYLQMWSIVVSAIYPMLMTILAFFICIHSVDGGFKPAANVNVNEVSDISGNSSTLSASGSGKSGTSTSHSASVKSNMRQLKAGITRRLNKFREFIVEVSKRAGLHLIAASAVLAILFVTQLMIVNAGMYVKAETAVQSGPIVGAAIFSWILNVPALAMYFHVNRNGSRYLSPFLLSISLLGSFFIIAKSSVWTYVKTRDISPAALEGKVVANSTLAAIVAVVCAAVCIALMAFNVNRLRMSRNVLDKVLTQVAGQVRGLESEIEYEGEIRNALKEQGEFLRRSLEVISLCRPIWRPYAIALALADPEDEGKLVAASAAATAAAAALGPLEKARQLAPAGTKKKAATTGAVTSGDNKSAVLSDGSAEEKETPADPVSGKAAGGGSKSKKDKPAGGAGATEESAGSASGATAPVSVPGQVLTPDVKTRNVAGSAASKAVTIVAPAAAAGSNAAAGQGPSDFVRIHAPKHEKQLVALLKEVADLNLSNAAPPRALADIRLPQLLSNPVTLELMKDVLAKNLSPENIACWIDIQRYRSLEQTAVRKAVADEIFSTFIVSGAKYEVNLSSFMRDYIQTQVYKGSSSLDLFDEVEREIYRLMVTNNTEPFAQSTMFKLAAIVLQHPQYKLKSMSLANNTKGEIGGNVASTLGQVVQATSGSGGMVTVGGGPSYGAPSTPITRTIGGGGNNSGGIPRDNVPRPSMFVPASGGAGANAAGPLLSGGGSNGATPIGTPSGSPRPAAGWGGASNHGRVRSSSGAQLMQQPHSSQDE